MVLGVLAIIFTMLLAIVVLAICIVKDLFLWCFPGPSEKRASQDHGKVENE